MRQRFIYKIKADLKESQINWKVALFFIPVAFFTYVFHEFGHWTFGEILGTEMTISLNNSAPGSGQFINETHALWSAIGGPLFTILQALIFLLIVKMTKSVYAYSLVFFAVFSRFFSIVFGGLNLQDEAGIASMLVLNKYLVATVVLALLFLVLWRSSRIMKMKIKSIGYYIVLGVFAVLIVIGTNELFFLK